jgi:hypothetical protein
LYRPARAITDALHRTCVALRESCGSDVDVEWAWVAGAVIVLQVRPVTVPIEGTVW